MRIELKILDERIYDWGVPTYATDGSAAIDLVACVSGSIIIPPGTSGLMPTGISVHIADPGVAAILLPRSGLGAKGLVLGNLVGLIDSDYTGPVMVSAWNRSDRDIEILPGQRFAQMIFVPIIRPTFSVVSEFSIETQRGAGGFGSTG